MAEVFVRVLGKDHRMVCEEEDIESIRQAADFLNETIRELRGSDPLATPQQLLLFSAILFADQVRTLSNELEATSRDLAAQAKITMEASSRPISRAEPYQYDQELAGMLEAVADKAERIASGIS